MNVRRLLLSLATLVFAGSVVAAGTGAFFSDEERSEGNMFTSGAIDLKVDSEAHYNNMVCVNEGTPEDPDYQWQPEDGFNPGPNHYPVQGSECVGTWTETDLGPSHTFFSYGDLKPGDHGENTLSLHVYDNDAWACVIIDDMSDVEVGDCSEPEAEEDDSCGDGLQGELAPELHFFAWAEEDGDNVWEPTPNEPETDEPVLFSNESGPASDVIDGRTYPLYTPDQNGGMVMPGDETQYIGLYWCYGDITVDPNGATFADRLSCSGADVTNLSQSDKVSADFTFYVEQSRNNPEFECPTPREPALPEAEVEELQTWSTVDTDAPNNGESENLGGTQQPFEVYAKMRGNNTANFELAAGIDDGAASGKTTADATWSDGITETWTLTYDGVSDLTLAVTGETPVTYAVGDRDLSRIGINVRAHADGTTAVDNVALDIAAPLADDDVSVTGGTASLNILGVDLSDGFVLSGDFTFSWTSPTADSQNGAESQKVQISID